MVKGTSRQVIVVQGEEPKVFEQAIFILRDGALGDGVTEEILLKEARETIRDLGTPCKKRKARLQATIWASAGAMITALIWMITLLI